MIGKNKLQRISDYILSKTKDFDQSEVSIFSLREKLTRFANNEIHQNVAHSNLVIQLRTIKSKKIAFITTNNPDKKNLSQLVEQCRKISMVVPETPEFVSLPDKKCESSIKNHSRKSAHLTPEIMAEYVKNIIEIGSEKDKTLQLYGSFSAAEQEYSISNSLGIRAYQPVTVCELRINSIYDDGTTKSYGWSDFVDKDYTKIPVEELTAESCDKALKSRNPKNIEPGKYPVLLEEYASATMLQYYGIYGMGARHIHEQKSFLLNRFNEKIVNENITICDDAFNELTIGLPFDFEGYPKQKVVIIENGIAKNVVYDSFFSNLDNKPNTGHAVPPSYSSIGPIPLNICLAPGTSSKDELIKDIHKGILITRFHYVRVVNERQALITGMTRDGTFMIENGEISYPVKNLRFTQSITEALSKCSGLGKNLKLESFDYVPVYGTAPALKIDEFMFTS